jgi:hypothetical protein
LDEALRTSLREAGFGWLIEQVDEAAAEGLYMVKPRGGRTSDVEPETVERASDARRGEIGTRPLTSEERLALLIDAAITAIDQTPLLEDEIQRDLIEPDPSIERIEFFDERTQTTVRALSRGETATPQRVRARDVVSELAKLRRSLSSRA